MNNLSYETIEENNGLGLRDKERREKDPWRMILRGKSLFMIRFGDPDSCSSDPNGKDVLISDPPKKNKTRYSKDQRFIFLQLAALPLQCQETHPLWPAFPNKYETKQTAT
ncbi:hypothetical protein HZH68_013724 [Vespula germanica]|uniref:Uncharacterized protein n=1 Tax=Vespula germanica TaxID=30212 RepID=A0A834MVL7_VESGE|nr:hypothetical protein HZH68_013724 [Vespula germanica]